MNKSTISAAGCCMLLSGVLAGAAQAACDLEGTTNAISVYSLGGQGNLTCRDLTGTNGEMQRIDPDLITLTPGLDTDPSTVEFAIDQSLGIREADAAIVEADDGKRCIFGYPGGITGDTGLKSASSKGIRSVEVCEDLLATGGPPPPPPPPPDPPLLTVDGQCIDPMNNEASQIQGAINADPRTQVVIGWGTDATGNLAALICSDSGAATTQPQVQCVNQCIAPPLDEMTGLPVFGPDSQQCLDDKLAQAGMLLPGVLPLSCRHCELDSDVPATGVNVPEEARYCWELSHKVDETAGTFIPPQVAEEASVNMRRYKGTTCFEIDYSHYFGVPYTIWHCVEP